MIIDPTNSGSRFSTGRFRAIEDYFIDIANEITFFQHILQLLSVTKSGQLIRKSLYWLRINYLQYKLLR